MEWKDLSNAAKCVIERCWGLYNDKAASYTVKIGESIQPWDIEYDITEDVYNEIVDYHKSNGDKFSYKRERNKVTVWGLCDYGEWVK